MLDHTGGTERITRQSFEEWSRANKLVPNTLQLMKPTSNAAGTEGKNQLVMLYMLAMALADVLDRTKLPARLAMDEDLKKNPFYENENEHVVAARLVRYLLAGDFLPDGADLPKTPGDSTMVRLIAEARRRYFEQRDKEREKRNEAF
ncbi:MAG: hypothetical protein HQL47_08975 [Gammaproteobacteria bacterium]|nr:hypothetical protein [Gammaproteobacteria bacterium]